MKNNEYSVEILCGGRSVREFNKYVDGEYRTFIEGRNGSEYQIKIRNNSYKKVLAIVAVDSINVVSGSISDGYKGRGYIIQPYDSVTVKGYRESDSTVGAFKFTNKSNSYASEKGIERNCGVIAVNLIAEKVIPPAPIKVVEEHHHHHYPVEPIKPYIPYDPLPRWICEGPIGSSGGSLSNSGGNYLSADMQTRSFATSSNDINVTKKSVANFDLGSTWGNRIEDKITRKHFDKGEIVSSFKIYYASRRSLENFGINFYNNKEVSWPEGFENEYCSPPKNWQ